MKRVFGTPEFRFWRRVIKTADCWEWSAAVSNWGYGIFTTKKQRVLTHRYSWELANGPIPAGKLICHHCDNPRCVRPDHLFLGTNADNMADMRNKGRGRALRGEKNPCAKLNNASADKLRKLHALGILSQETIGILFGVSQVRVSQIARGKGY